MAADLEEFVERYHRTVEAFIKGDPSPQERIWSRHDDVTLAGNPARSARARVDRGVGQPPPCGYSQLSDGEVLAVERISGYSSGDLAYIIEIEQARVRLGGAREPADVSLRVTSIFRREEDGWRVLHRHADPITTPRPAESMVQE